MSLLDRFAFLNTTQRRVALALPLIVAAACSDAACVRDERAVGAEPPGHADGAHLRVTAPERRQRAAGRHRSQHRFGGRPPQRAQLGWRSVRRGHRLLLGAQ